MLITCWFKGFSFIWSNMLQADCEIMELQISPCCLMSTRGSFHPIPAPKKGAHASHQPREPLVETLWFHLIRSGGGFRLNDTRIWGNHNCGFYELAVSWNKAAIGLNDFFAVGVIAFQSLIELYNTGGHLGICQNTAIHWWLIRPPTVQRVIEGW